MDKIAKIFTTEKRDRNKAIKSFRLPLFTKHNKDFSDYISYSLSTKDNKLIDAIKYLKLIGYDKLRKVIKEESKVNSNYLYLRSRIYLKRIFPELSRLELDDHNRLLCDLYYHWINQKIELKYFNK